MIKHKLAVNTDARPVKQVLRKQSKEFIVSETDKLLEAGVIKVVPHPTWVANPVVVPKPMTSKLRLSIDFTNSGFHDRLRVAMLPGCLLRVSSDLDGG